MRNALDVQWNLLAKQILPVHDVYIIKSKFSVKRWEMFEVSHQLRSQISRTVDNWESCNTSWPMFDFSETSIALCRHRHMKLFIFIQSKSKWQISLQKKEGKKSNPHRICHTEKSKLLSIIKRKPSSTARLKDTTQTRTRSISWRDTNRPSSFASEQATADWIAISRGLA